MKEFVSKTIDNLSFYNVSINSLLNVLMIGNIAFWMRVN